MKTSTYENRVYLKCLSQNEFKLNFLFMKNLFQKATAVIAIMLFAIFQAAATDYFVAVGGVDTNPGTSWSSPFLTVTKALSVTAGTGVNHRIFVKQGTYIMTATGYTFINSSITLQGGFPTAAAGTDISGYSPSNLTTLDYNGASPSANGTIAVQNTGAGPYSVSIKGMTVTKTGGTAAAYFFRAILANTANTTFSISDMIHKSSLATNATNTDGSIYCFYDFDNLLASNSVAFTNCIFDNLRGNGTTASKAVAITMSNSAVAATLTTCTFSKMYNIQYGTIFLDNITANPIINIATDNVFINNTTASQFVLRGNTGDFILDGLTTPIDGNSGASFYGTFIFAIGRTSQTGTVGINNPGKITINNCTFSNNTNNATSSGSGVYGGAVISVDAYGGRGDITITNNTFLNNASTGASNMGGALGFKGSVTGTTNIPKITITNNTFTGNTSSSTSGCGAVAFTAGEYSDININNNTFTANKATAAAEAGAIKIFQVDATVLNIKNNEFTNNIAGQQGGAIYFLSTNAPINIEGNSFCGNQSTTTEGGALYFGNTPSIVTIDNNVFYDNRVILSSQGSAIYVTNITSIQIKNSTFTLNQGGSAVYLSTVADPSAIDQCVFVRNVGNGAVLNLSQVGATFNVTKCNFSDNFNQGGASAGISINPSVLAKPISIEDCLFDGNWALSGVGGAINSGTNTVAGAANIRRCIFKNNYVGLNPLVTDVEDSDVMLNLAFTIDQATITDSYLQAPLVIANYTAENIAPASGNVQISSTNLFNKTVPNGCNAVPLVYQLLAPVATAAGTINCPSTQIISAPVSGTASNHALYVSVNVTTAGAISPITVSGAGFTLLDSPYELTAAATGLQTFVIPVRYDGTALSGNLNFTVGDFGSCTANMAIPSKVTSKNVYSLDGCTAVVPGTLTK